MLLRNKPRILKSSQPEFAISVKDTKDFQIGLDHQLFAIEPHPTLVRATDRITREAKKYEEQLDVQDIAVKDFADRVPLKAREPPIIDGELPPEEEKFTYRLEEEKTKRFVLDALTLEMARLDQTTEHLLRMAQEQNNKMGEIQKSNDEVEQYIRQQVKDQQLY